MRALYCTHPLHHLHLPRFSIDAGEVSMKRRKNGGQNAIKITKHARRYYTAIDLFWKHAAAEESRSER